MIQKQKTRQPTKFTYTYEDLEKLTGHNYEYLRKMKQRGIFNPYDLESVIRFVVSEKYRRENVEKCRKEKQEGEICKEV